MIELTTGRFYGQTNERMQVDGISLTDTVYTHPRVDWHYHQNPYFTFILQGAVIEGNKKETHHCTPGTLLFHNWQEPHYNIKPDGFTRGFHIEMEQSWINRYAVSFGQLEGSLRLQHPHLKLLVYQIFRELKRQDAGAALPVSALLLELLAAMQRPGERLPGTKPKWVNTLKAILHEQPAESYSLEALSNTLGIHPVHLSRQFPTYFHCTLSAYIRKVRVERSLALMSNKNHSLTEIGMACGFCDQSHFIRSFKETMGLAPLAYRRMLLS